MVDNREQVRDFLSSRRARVTPEQAGLPAYGGANRRVKGLRREEVALLAGISIDYYIRMERGDLAGASDAVLDGVGRTSLHAASGAGSEQASTGPAPFVVRCWATWCST